MYFSRRLNEFGKKPTILPSKVPKFEHSKMISLKLYCIRDPPILNIDQENDLSEISSATYNKIDIDGIEWGHANFDEVRACRASTAAPIGHVQTLIQGRPGELLPYNLKKDLFFQNRHSLAVLAVG